MSKWSSMDPLPRPLTRTISSIPAATASSTMSWIVGVSTIGSISLGIALVAGGERVPRTAAGGGAGGWRVPATFHYAVPDAARAAACVGARVLVPFGRRGVTGVIVRRSSAPPAGVDEIRTLGEVLDDVPALDPALIELCLWVADHYEAPPGEVLRAALPAGAAGAPGAE